MNKRQAGVLLHITSLPGNQAAELGKINQQAWRFVDWLAECGFGIWQLLPLTHTHNDGSPYHALSAFAMDPKFLPADIEPLTDKQWQDFNQANSDWLDDYAMFMVLRAHFNEQAWLHWPDEYKLRDCSALEEFVVNHADKIEQVKRQQALLHHQWAELKNYANQKQVRLFGDMPLFVALDSADVWAHPYLFKLDEHANPKVVAGVPPDYFSETGQRWGNPHYNWQRMQDSGFEWWHRRVKYSLQQFDWLRIDHFRGLESCWEIDADEPTAINGRWVPTPGKELLQSLLKDFDELPLIAEDLGVITEEVLALKEAFELPGMAVMQFGFDGLPDNPHAIGAQSQNTVVYTGTHDNDTTLGWWQELDQNTKQWISSQLQTLVNSTLNKSDLPNDMPWWLIAVAMQSSANKAIVPLQDLLMLDSSARMNTPGTTENNWLWQFQWQQIDETLAARIHRLLTLCDRTHNVETPEVVL